MQSVSPFWSVPTTHPPLAGADVHVWRVALDVPDEALERLSALLAPDEQARAARYRYHELRREFAVGRGALRLLLGRYLGVDPAAIRFEYEERGRPLLAAPFAASGLRFNLSNARDLALIAFTHGRGVGIDLETDRRRIELKDVATHFFAPAECAALFSLPESQQRPAFFNCWTRKEAYLKARGMGLSRPLDRFVMTLAPGEPARLLRDEIDPGAETRWSLVALDGLPGYTAALAVEGCGFSLSGFDFRLAE